MISILSNWSTLKQWGYVSLASGDELKVWSKHKFRQNLGRLDILSECLNSQGFGLKIYPFGQTSCIIVILFRLLYMTASCCQWLRMLVGAGSTESLTSDVTWPLFNHMTGNPRHSQALFTPQSFRLGFQTPIRGFPDSKKPPTHRPLQPPRQGSEKKTRCIARGYSTSPS